MPSPIRRQRRSIGEVASDWLGATTDVLNRGLVAGVVGAPVDIASTVLRPFIPGIGESPVGGSEWIGNKMQQAGMVSSKRRPIAEFAASLIDPATAPAAIAKSASLGAAKLSMLPLVIGQTVWHGSPHKFDKFDSSKIGTGEGAQAYGYGMYLAESPDVANAYKSNLVKDPTFVEKKTGRVIRKGSDEYADLLERQARMERNGYGAEFDKKFQVQEGSLYKVDLPDTAISKMLDWDKPLSEQPESVRDAFEKLGIDESVFPQWTGQQAYEGEIRALTEFDGVPKDIAKQRYSEQLRQAGIPGIRYLDGGSRGTGQGTSNFVVFPGNEGLLTILERNGVPIVPEPK